MTRFSCPRPGTQRCLRLAPLLVFSFAFALAAHLAPRVLAQAGVRAGAAADAADAGRYFTETAYVLPSPLSLDGFEFGDVDTFEAQVSYQVALPTSERYSWLAGVELRGTWFDVPGTAPIPDALYETSLRVGALWRPADAWSLQVLLSPGFYSDFEDLDGSDLNVPGLILLFWQTTERLQLIAGASVDVRRDTPVIPALGGRWRFADDWTLLAVFPTPRIEYAVNGRVTTWVGAELVRSAYRVAKDFGDRVGRPELNDENLSYNEWRVGVGVRWQAARWLTVSLDGGWMGDREFNYDDRDVELESDGAPYVQLGFGGRF